MEAAVRIQVIQVVFTGVIAVAAVYIAWRQAEIARAKLRLDLFDRRFRVYRGLMDLLDAVSQETPLDAPLSTFYRETDEKRFLFDSDIVDYLKEVREKAVKLKLALQKTAALREHQSGTVESKATDAIDESLDLRAWLEDQIEAAQRKFLKYLDFKRNL